MYKALILKSMEGKNEVLLNLNSDGLQSTDKMEKCKNAVCLIYAKDSGNLRQGTGFFAKLEVNGIEFKCIVTNNHVLPTKDSASDGEARFFYEGSRLGVPIDLEPETLFHTNEDLDYSLIGCDVNALENELFVTPLEFTDLCGSVNDDIFIFQHPKGEPKQFSYQKICNIKPPYLYYKADTDIGSSGSPVLRKFQLLGVHCKGSEWEKYNKGTLCSAILQDLSSVKYSSSADILKNARNSRKREALKTICEASPAKKVNQAVQCVKDPEQMPIEKELNALSKDIAINWKRLGRELDLDHNLIMNIHKDNINHDDIVEKAFAMLVKWKEKKGALATYGVLRKALEAIDMVATANKHC